MQPAAQPLNCPLPGSTETATPVKIIRAGGNRPRFNVAETCCVLPACQLRSGIRSHYSSVHCRLRWERIARCIIGLVPIVEGCYQAAVGPSYLEDVVCEWQSG